MPAVSLNQVNDAQLRDALAHSSRSSRKALYEVAQAHGVETSTEQTQLLPVDEAGMPTVSIDDELVPEPMPGETTPESSEVAAAYPPSRPVPMTGMIPRVPNSPAAPRWALTGVPERDAEGPAVGSDEAARRDRADAFREHAASPVASTTAIRLRLACPLLNTASSVFPCRS